MLDSRKLKSWLDARLNVLVEGKHGVGKTTIILDAFREAGLRYAYFSGSTLDPFIDFVGIPVKVETSNGNYIDCIRPKHLAGGDIQVIFIDEFNRTHKKVRNAVMELIQFGQINGKPLGNDWYGVWAAINPDSTNEEQSVYDTDRLDPAQRDRFQIHIKLPYECDESYFCKKYGNHTGRAAVQYWNELPAEQKELVSPRRLDYAVKHYTRNGDIRDILPLSSSPNRLTNILSVGPAIEKIQKLREENKIDEIKQFLANESQYDYVINTILSDKKFMQFFMPLIPLEKFSALILSDKSVLKFVCSEVRKTHSQHLISPFIEPIKEVVKANQNKSFTRKLKDLLDEISSATYVTVVPSNKINEYYSPSPITNYDVAIKNVFSHPLNQTYYRKQGYDKILNCLPFHMSAESAIQAMKVMDKLSCSYLTTIQQHMPKLDSMSTHCLCVLFRSNYTREKIITILNNVPFLKKYRSRVGAPSLSDIETYARYNKVAPR